MKLDAKLIYVVTSTDTVWTRSEELIITIQMAQSQ